MLKHLGQSLIALALLVLSPLAAIAETPATYEEAYPFDGAPRYLVVPDDEMQPKVPIEAWAQVPYEEGWPYLAESMPLFLKMCGIDDTQLTALDFYTDVAAYNGHNDPNKIPAGLLWVPAPENTCESVLAALEGRAERKSLAADTDAMAALVLALQERVDTAEQTATTAMNRARMAGAAARQRGEAIVELKSALEGRIVALEGLVAALETSSQEQGGSLSRLGAMVDNLLGQSDDVTETASQIEAMKAEIEALKEQLQRLAPEVAEDDGN